jgi:uncharacterized protein involved in high-affinity Fe2+ transport
MLRDLREEIQSVITSKKGYGRGLYIEYLSIVDILYNKRNL